MVLGGGEDREKWGAAAGLGKPDRVSCECISDLSFFLFLSGSCSHSAGKEEQVMCLSVVWEGGS